VEPINVSLVLPESCCSNHCVFCNSREMGDIDSNVEFELDKLRRLATQSDINQVEISGNDPGEYPQLADFIRDIREIASPRHIQLSTHARPLKDLSFFRELVDAGMTLLRVPIYGATPRVHDAVTQAPGSFEDTFQAFRNATRLKFPVDVTSLVLKENQDSLHLLIYAFSKMKFARSFRLGLPAFVETQARFLPSIPDFEALRRTLPQALKYALLLGLKVEVADLPYCLLGFDYPDVAPLWKSTKGYEFRRCEKQGVEIVDGEVFPTYLKKTKAPPCETCVYNSKCEGIFKAYYDQGFFEFRPVKST